MAERFRFMLFGLVRLRTLAQCMCYLDVHARAGGADVSLRDAIVAQMGNGASKCE